MRVRLGAHIGGALAAVILAASVIVSPRVSAATPPPPENKCSDRFWRYTLRCQLHPTQRPQLNWGTIPALGDLADFTRVFLTAPPILRSIDGTLPLMYVDKAACTDPAGCEGVGYGEPIDSDKWVISMTGGGSCFPQDTGGDLAPDDASLCVENYLDPAERDEMGTAMKKPMINLSGINRADPERNLVFAGYNRIRIQKSSYDRYNGRATYQASGGYFEYNTGSRIIHFNLYQHGFLFIEQAVRALTPGLTYTTWQSDGSGGVEAFTESLPPLRDADVVLFVGHSGGAHGLSHNIDHLATMLGGLPGFAGDVRALLDATFIESAEAEATFATDDLGNPLGGDAYTGQWAGNSVGDGEPFSYDGANHYSTGPDAQEFASWEALPDASCVETHTATDGETWQCHDLLHVIFNHMSTPYFFREDFTDPNKAHTNDGLGHNILWAEFANYPWCPSGPPCPPRFNLAEHRERLEQQVQTLIDDSAARSELATGTDPTLAGAGTFPTFYAWMPECHTHNGAFDDASFFETRISYLGSGYSMREWLERFMEEDRADVTDWRIDGWTDGAGNEMTTDSPPCPLLTRPSGQGRTR